MGGCVAVGVAVGVPTEVGVAIGVTVRVAVGVGLGVRVLLTRRLACAGCASVPASTANRVQISTNSASCFRIMFIEHPPNDCVGEKPEREVLSCFALNHRSIAEFHDE